MKHLNDTLPEVYEEAEKLLKHKKHSLALCLCVLMQHTGTEVKDSIHEMCRHFNASSDHHVKQKIKEYGETKQNKP